MVVALGGGAKDGSHMDADAEQLVRLARVAMSAAPLPLLDEARALRPAAPFGPACPRPPTLARARTRGRCASG